MNSNTVVNKKNLLIERLKEFPFVLAPMASITNAPYRRLMKEFGAGIVVSELISASGLQYEGKKTQELCQYFEEERPIGLQIFGEDAEVLANAAKQIEGMGADFVDINLGCPVPKVVKKGGGAALLRDPLALHMLLKQVREAITVPLTIKIRTGWDSCSINASECIAAGAEAGVTWVAVHGRTRAQGYEGSADWDLIAKLKETATIPIIGNGDIQTAKQAQFRLSQSGCDAVMIGRGALRDPFIFQQIRMLRDPSAASDISNYLSLVQRHIELMQLIFRPFHVGVQLRKFLTWYSAGMEGASAFRKRLYETTIDDSAENINAVVAMGIEFFGRDDARKKHSYLEEPFLKGGHG